MGMCPIRRREQGHHVTINDVVKLMPTSNSRDYKDHAQTQGHRKSPNLGTVVQMYPTVMVQYADKAVPRMREGKQNGLTAVLGGTLNPLWVEWLMGWPLGWTDVAPMPVGSYTAWHAASSRGLHGLRRWATGR